MSVKPALLSLLSDDQVRDIHLASLTILERTGVVVPNREILGRLEGSGAKVDSERQRVWLPAELVEESIRKAPSRFTWYGVDPSYKIEMGRDEVHFGPATGALHVLEADGQRRPATAEDAGNFSRLVDALDNLNGGHCVVHPVDVPEKARHAHMMLAIMRNTRKCFRGRIWGQYRAQDCIRMAEILADGFGERARRPNVIANINPFSPLAFDRESLDGALEYLNRGLPVIFGPEVQVGASGPATLAGSMAQHNAEVLSGITIAQVVSPGNPVVYGCVSTTLDMRSGLIAYAAIEAGMLTAMAAQLARFYQVPSRGTGGYCDAVCLDMQAGLETPMNLMMAALAGANYIVGAAGGLEQSLGASFEKLIIDDQIIGALKRVLAGVEVNESSLCIDLIDKVGPGGTYLTEAHTARTYRQEVFTPDLIRRISHEAFEAGGGKGIVDLAREKAQRLLETHHPTHLSRDVEKELLKVVKMAEEREVQ